MPNWIGQKDNMWFSKLKRDQSIKRTPIQQRPHLEIIFERHKNK